MLDIYFVIVAKMRGRSGEDELDTAQSKNEANCLVRQYQDHLGPQWVVSSRKSRCCKSKVREM